MQPLPTRRPAKADEPKVIEPISHFPGRLYNR